MVFKKEKKYFTLCFDLEKFNIFTEFNEDTPEDEQYNLSYQGSEKINLFLRKTNIQATFFVTEDMALKYPTLIGHLGSQGHEIALHYDISNGITADVKVSKEKLEKVCRKQVFGFKMHRFDYYPDCKLKELGFCYNNSLHPTFVPSRYCNIFEKREIHERNGIWNVPVSVTPFLRLPFSWLWFRNLGVNYAKICAQQIFLINNFINIYFHSWDFMDISCYNTKRELFFISRNSGDKCLEYLNNFLNWLRKQDVYFISIREYLNRNILRKL